MPGKVRVKILAGRNLPVMDRGSDTTDAYVEIKLANTTYKTDVYRKSLNPQWNSDFYRFDLDDAELQDEPLQIRLMDHDTYSANDAIGKVNISLSPLLLPLDAASGQTAAVMSGWIPVYDTMHGIRGEVNVIVKVDLFSDVNKFRQSSCGVQFFHSASIPYGYHAQLIHGFVEELVVNDDPEYQWIDKIRTPRASNEARQTVFLRLSGQVQRKIGLKALDLGANAVIGYNQCFDLEGDVGVVARGIGTAVTLIKIHESIAPPMADNVLLEEQIRYYEFLTQTDLCTTSIDSKFDIDKFSPSSGDIISKMFGLSSDKNTNIILNKKSVKNDKCFHDLDKLKRQLDQEDGRGEMSKTALRRKLRKIGKSSKNLLTCQKQKIKNLESELTGSTNDNYRVSPTSSLKSSLTDLRGKIKQGIRLGGKHKYQRSSSCGVGMATLLVRSMMAAPSLDCIDETPGKNDQGPSFLKPIDLGPESLKISDSNLSSNFSESTCTMSSTSDNNDEEEEEEEEFSESEVATNDNETILVDADTVSMVIKSILAQEQSENMGKDWIEPESESSEDNNGKEVCPMRDEIKMSKSHKDICDLKNSEELCQLLKASANEEDDAKDWIQPGSTTDDMEYIEKRRGSLFHDLRENISEKFHSIQEKFHHSPTMKKKHGLLGIALDTMLVEQAKLLGAPLPLIPQDPIVDETKEQQRRHSISVGGLRQKILHPFTRRASDTHTGLVRKSEMSTQTDDIKPLELGNRDENKQMLQTSTGTATISVIKTLCKQNRNPETYSSALEIECIKEFAPPFASLTELKSSNFNENSVDCTLLNSPIIVPQSETNPISSIVASVNHPQVSTFIDASAVNQNNNNLCDINTTNKAFLLAPSNFPIHRSENINQSAKPSGHIRADSAGDKLSQSPAKSGSSTSGGGGGVSGGPVATPSGSSNKDAVCRRSSDSDLNVTPKGSSLSTIDRPLAAGLLRISGTSALKTPLNQDTLDMLEYPFLTMSKYPVGFILHLGATVCARSVKLLERVPNPDEPETRDFWWTELRMEIRSHARSLGCNVVIGYCEVTTISDEVCVLSATGTAAVINLQFKTGEVGLLNAAVPSKAQPSPMISSAKDDGEVFQPAKLGTSKDGTSGGTLKSEVETDASASSIIDSTIQNASNCTICHIPYSVTSVPYNVRMKKCAVCKQGRVPDVLLATIEIPDNIQITGRGCFLQAQVCRTKKDLKSESNAKEISDGLPFLEYDLHRLLINKLRTKGMNAIFGLKATVAVGEKMMALIATGTAVFLSALPAPLIPKIVAGNSWTNAEKLSELQKMLKDTFDRNREIYQLKPFGDINVTVNPAQQSDTEESDDEQNEIDLTINNKDTCVIEVDDIEDLETISLLMEPCPPDGFHVVNTQTVPGLNDLEVVRNLQMFTQVWRAKLTLNQQGSNFPRHFQRLLQTIFFKLRTMVPCAICDLKFRLDLPESEEIQVLVTGMALGLGEPSKLTKYKRKVAASPQTKESKKIADDELIFSLEEEQLSDSPSSGSHQQLIQTNSLKLKSKSPTRARFNSVRLSRHLPVRERYGVDVTYLGYVPGGKIDRYLGNLNFFFIRECTSVRENGGISGFVHSFITEILAVVRAHITALGGNALVSFYMTELILNDNPHKNQGQCLISVGGDVVFVSYYTDD